MKEIEVGEYVRTKDGEIHKVIEIKENKYIIGFDDYFYYIYDNNMGGFKSNIVNHNKIISEIVEVGDYVNGKLIHKIDKGPNYCYLYYGNCKTFVDYQIKSIVTKEQMKSVEYEVN